MLRIIKDLGSGRERSRHARRASRLSRERIVVVGSGMVAHRFCQELVRRELTGVHAVTVVGEEASPAYDRIRLSQTLDQEVDQLLLSPASWYETHGIALRTGVRVASIERDVKRVVLSDDSRLEYDRLVLATGSRPMLPDSLALPEDPDGRRRIHVFRDFSDLVSLREVAAPGVRFAVIGGGLLGLETAKALRDRDCAIELIEAADHLMTRQLDRESAAVLNAHVDGLGIGVRLNHLTESIAWNTGSAAGGGPLELRFQDEKAPLSVEHVVIAVGVEPRDELARACALPVGARGGVLVDDQLRTSDPAICAIGECATHRGVTYGLVSPGYRMAEVLADSLLGMRRARFEGADISCHLKLLGLPVSAVGIYDQEATLVATAVTGGRRTLMLDGRRLIGATAVGAWAQLPRVHDAIEQGTFVSQSQLRRFDEEGELFGGGDLVTVSSWPASTIVCNCEGVSRGQLTACVAGGASDVASLTERTGAGGVCGSCRPLLGQIVGQPVSSARSLARPLVLASSCIALVVASAYVLLEPIAFARSVQVARHELDALWRDDLVKQWTGYSLVGITALGGLLSLRKRVRWFSLGGFNGYRALHTIVGTLALAGLVAHTGLHFGDNLNFWLMTVFMAATLLGAVAGIATALEAGPDGVLAQRARRLRRPLTWSHLLLFWPLPLLLGLHVFAVYYF